MPTSELAAQVRGLLPCGHAAAPSRRCRSGTERRILDVREVSVLGSSQLRLRTQLRGTTKTHNQWEPLARLSTTADAIDQLRDLLADIVSIISFDLARCPHPGYTGDLALTLDQPQYATGRGPLPSLEAVLQRQPVRAEISADADRGRSSYRRRAAGRSASACQFSARRRPGRRAGAVGSLNIQLHRVRVRPFDQALMRLFSVAAGQADHCPRRRACSTGLIGFRSVILRQAHSPRAFIH